MVKIPILFEQKETEYRFSYAIGCFPTLWNPHLTTHPLSELNALSIKEKLKEPDETGRFQVLGIYQKSLTRTKEEFAEQSRNEHFVDLMIREGGKIYPWLGFDHIRRDLILVAYEDFDQEEFQRKVRRKLSKKELKARNELFGTMKEVVTKLAGEMPDKKNQIRNTNFHEQRVSYFRHDDILRRLSIHHINNLPDVLQKDTSFIRNFYRKIQGKDHTNLTEYLDEALSVLVKAGQTRDSYGLTRDEFIFLEGSAMNTIATLKSEQEFSRINPF